MNEGGIRVSILQLCDYNAGANPSPVQVRSAQPVARLALRYEVTTRNFIGLE